MPPSKKGYDMFVSKKIVEAAHAALEKEGDKYFPMQITGYPAYYISPLKQAVGLQAFGGIVFQDMEYVIGTKK
jgi:hypothetical protein